MKRLLTSIAVIFTFLAPVFATPAFPAENLYQEKDRLRREIGRLEEAHAKCREEALRINDQLDCLRRADAVLIKKYQYRVLLAAENVVAPHVIPGASAPARDLYDQLVSEESRLHANRLVDTKRLIAKVERMIAQKERDLQRVKARCDGFARRIPPLKTRIAAIDRQLNRRPSWSDDRSTHERKGAAHDPAPGSPAAANSCGCLAKWLLGEEKSKAEQACRQVRGSNFRGADLVITSPFRYDARKGQCIGSYEKRCVYYEPTARKNMVSVTRAHEQAFGSSFAQQKCR